MEKNYLLIYFIIIIFGYKQYNLFINTLFNNTKLIKIIFKFILNDSFSIIIVFPL